MIRNAAPPPFPTSKGNFHIFPNPTALPAAAAMNPNLDENLFLFCTIESAPVWNLSISLKDQIKYIEPYNANKIEIFQEIVILTGFHSKLVFSED